MVSRGSSTVRAPFPCNSVRTFPFANPARRPSKNLASSTGSVVVIFANRPRNRSKSVAFFSARSIPGELTSRMYPGPGTSSSTSRITLSCWLTRSQSAWLIFGNGSFTTLLAPSVPPASLITAAGFGTRSMYTRRNRCLPIFHSTSTISRPSERATRSAASRIFSKSKQRLLDRSRSAVHSNRPNKKVGLRPLLRATRLRAKLKYIPAVRQKQDKGPPGLVPYTQNAPTGSERSRNLRADVILSAYCYGFAVGGGVPAGFAAGGLVAAGFGAAG